jgi:DNA-binding beta-propeller fold protein YncE
MGASAPVRVRRVARRHGAVAVVTAVLIVLGTIGLSEVAVAAPGDDLWTTRYNGPGNGNESEPRVAVSPDGTKIYVTGASIGSSGFFDYATVAYNAATGVAVWTKRYNGPANNGDRATAIAVSPDGTKVYVTGWSAGGPATRADYATIAYNASTGALLWIQRYNNSAVNSGDLARALAVSPDGSKVAVTGESIGSTGSQDYATVVYNAMTGAVLSTMRYNGAADKSDAAYALVFSPHGSRVYVTGSSFKSFSADSSDYATVAYNASTGAVIWTKLYNGPANNEDVPSKVALSPDGTKVYVTGRSVGSTTSSDYATIAYNTTTGAQVWGMRYNGPGSGADDASGVVVSPDGTKVYVTGWSLATTGNCTCDDYTTIAYNATTGAFVWIRRYNGPANHTDEASAIAVSPDNSKVYVTGHSDGSTINIADYATIAYDAATGVVGWVSRYDGPRNDSDYATAVVVSPDSTKVYVTGQSLDVGYPSTTKFDFATIAYSAT